ncbi:MAG TPA: hypothetical protein VK993_08365 [Chthoniobacterales bacterium]|nr:hypothetical protein [Chthoniobacterales bacterium]
MSEFEDATFTSFASLLGDELAALNAHPATAIARRAAARQAWRLLDLINFNNSDPPGFPCFEL